MTSKRHGYDESVDTAVTQFLGALDSRNSDKLRGVLAPDFLFEEVAGPGERSIAALVEEATMLFAAFPDLAFRPVRIAEEGERVYVEFRALGTHCGQLLGVAPTEAFVIFGGVFNLLLSGNEVQRLRLTIDFAGLRRQLLVAQARNKAGPPTG